MTGPTTQEYQPLSQALQFQSQQPELPRLHLAPPEHQKHLQSQAQAKRQRDGQDPSRSSASPVAQRSDEHATSISSSREVSPVVGVEGSQTASGQKRKSGPSKGATSKKRKTDQVQEQFNDAPIQYGLGTHYPYTYTYPGAPPPPPISSFNQPTAASHQGAPGDMSFNEFQWRLLNLCGEFYEAATELIRSTPHLVLSQAFQIIDRGTGLDPISVLNEARRTCDILLANPQALSAAPPPPTALPLAALTSLAHLNSRPNASSVSAPAPAPAPAPATNTPSYYPSQSSSMVVESYNPKSKEKDRPPNNVQGTWKDHEVQKLKALAEKYKLSDKAAVAEEEEEEEEEEAPGAEGSGEGADGENASKLLKKTKTSEINEVDWDKVIEEFGDERSRHQVLIKATYLGLKPSSSLPGKKPKKKRSTSTTTLPPPLTFSSASAKSIPTGYNPSHINNTQLTSATPNASTTMAAQPKPSTSSASANANDQHKTAMVPPPPAPPQHHPHQMHAPYGQTGWYPHPQNPYYAYHQMYYSPHPQGYAMPGYGMQPPQAYYPQPYAVPPGAELPPPEKPPPTKGKRRTAHKDATPASAASTTPIPPPSLPPKAPPVETTTSTKPMPTPVSVAVTPGASKAADAPASDASTPQATPVPSTNTPTGTASSGVLRRGNNSLFTYTPLPHGPGSASTEPAKEA